MKSENNGKIAIAIVAMFVVAMAIVGVTYAYFTASVIGNSEDTSVEVTAGILEINYASGAKLEAENIVPGWESNGQYYYDPTGSIYATKDDQNNDIKAIKAITAADCKTEANPTGTAVCSIDEPGKANGITEPLTFSVTNTSRNTGDTYYAIKLVEVINTVQDSENLTYELYRVGTTETKTGGTLVATGDVVTGTEASKGSQVIVYKEETLASTNKDAQWYYLKLKYANDGDQNASMGQTVTATVKVVGITETETGWVDADGTPVVFETEVTGS